VITVYANISNLKCEICVSMWYMKSNLFHICHMLLICRIGNHNNSVNVALLYLSAQIHVESEI
jgi:hypothetical protein